MLKKRGGDDSFKTQQTLDLSSNVFHNPLVWDFAMHMKNVSVTYSE